MCLMQLINYGLVDLIAPHHLLFLDAPNSVRMLGKPATPAACQPWSLVQIIELIVFLPLTFSLYVGTPTFLIITGARLGKLSQYRWYKLRELSRKDKKKEIRGRAWDYTWLGTVAMILELIPILSFFFPLTTTTGSAMWAAKMEKEKRGQAGDGEAAEAAESGHYEDNPV